MSASEIRDVVPSLSVGKLRVMLTVLKQERRLRERRGSKYELLPTLFDQSLESLARAYEERRQRDVTKLEQMVVYAQTAMCRTRVLLDALGEQVEWSECGTCDNCNGLAERAVGITQGAA